MNIDSLEHVSWIPFEAEMKHVFFVPFFRAFNLIHCDSFEQGFLADGKQFTRFLCACFRRATE